MRLTERQQLAAAMAASAADYQHASDAAMKTTRGTETTRAMTTVKTTTTPGRGPSPGVQTPHARGEDVIGGAVTTPHAAAAAMTPTTTPPKGRDLYGALESNKRNRSRQAKELASLAPWAWDPLVGKHAPGPSALRDFSEVVTDKTLVASASGAISSVAVRTFTRFPAEDVGVEGRAAKTTTTVKTTTTTTTTTVKAVKTALKTKDAVEKTTPVTAEVRVRDSKKRARTTMGAAVTPLKLASTLDEASEREKPAAGTRSSARATAAAAAAARAVTVQVSNKENTAPKAKREQPAPVASSRAASRAALKEVKNAAPAAAAPKRKATEEKPAAKVAVAPATAVVVAAPAPKTEEDPMFITPAPAKKKSRARVSVAETRRQSYALECLLAKTYVKAIRHPIMPSMKPSRRLLDAYRAFSKSRVVTNERGDAPTELKIGAALERGLDALVAEDDSYTR